MKKNKKYSTDAEFEMLHERAMINAQYMKSREEDINHPFND